MEIKFRRLIWLIALTSLIGFLTAAGWSYYKERSMQRAVISGFKLLDKSISECEKNRNSTYCEFIEDNKRLFDSTVEAREYYSDKVTQYLVAAFALPTLAVFMFLALRWVFTGQKPQWLGRKSSNPL